MSSIAATISTTTQRMITAAAIGFAALAPAAVAIEMASAPVAMASEDGIDTPHPAAPHAPITHEERDMSAPPQYWQVTPTPGTPTGVGIQSHNAG